MNNTEQIQQPSKSRAKKFILIGLGLTALGVASYYGWNYFKSRSKKNDEDFISPELPEIPAPKTSYTPLPKRDDSFPLKKGSKGDKVMQVQNALITKHGKSILPKYGADGDFGSEMVAALQKAGLPSSIDETTFNVLTKSSSGSFEAGTLAKELYDSAVKKDFAKVISGLSKMKSTDDYKSVGDIFKTYFLRGVRQTLVNGILGTFADASQKQQVQLQFSRMGLKYDGSKWSLAGIAGEQIITQKQTWVYKYPNQRILVEQNVILGREIATRQGFTLFQSIDNHKLIVKTQDVNYYEKH